MVSRKTAKRLASLSILFTTARAQIPFTPTTTTTAASPSSTAASSPSVSSKAPASSSSSSSTTLRASFTTVVVPLYLHKAVESLLDDLTSARQNNPSSLSYPSTLAIGTVTYGLQKDAATKSSSTSSHSVAATNGSQRTTARAEQSNNQAPDKRLGIILGVVLGFVALALMAGLFWFLARRKRKAGSFFMRRSSPSNSSTRSGAPAPTIKRSSRVQSMSAMRQGESALLAPGLHQKQHSRSDSEDMPSQVPPEHTPYNSEQRYMDGRRAELARIIRGENAYRKPPAPTTEAAPPVPFSPASIQQPVPSSERRQSDHVVSPISPSKSFEKETTSIVHYPSMDEVNDFDFAGDGRRRASAGGQTGWHPARQRIEGRHEMA